VTMITAGEGNKYGCLIEMLHAIMKDLEMAPMEDSTEGGTVETAIAKEQEALKSVGTQIETRATSFRMAVYCAIGRHSEVVRCTVLRALLWCGNYKFPYWPNCLLLYSPSPGSRHSVARENTGFPLCQSLRSPIRGDHKVLPPNKFYHLAALALGYPMVLLCSAIDLWLWCYRWLSKNPSRVLSCIVVLYASGDPRISTVFSL